MKIERLKQVIKWGSSNSFYKNKVNIKGVNIKIKNLKDFQKLPFITSDDLRKHSKAFPSVDRKEIYSMFATGGTTGTPKFIYWTLKAHELAAKHLSKHLKNLIPQNKLAVLIVPADNLASVGDVVKRALGNIGVISASMGLTFTDNQNKQLAKVMINEDPYIIMGSPARLESLVKNLKDQKINTKKLGVKLVFSASEVLTKKTREYIEKELNAKVYEWGGMTELGATTIQCKKRDGQHIIDDTVFAEVLDLKTSEPIKEGVGELVLTTLINPAYPLIRYKTEDIVRITNKKCSCGLNSPRIWYKCRKSESFDYHNKTFYTYQFTDCFNDISFLSSNFQIDIKNKGSKKFFEIKIEVDKKNINKKNILNTLKKMQNNPHLKTFFENKPEIKISLMLNETLKRTSRGKIANKINIL